MIFRKLFERSSSITVAIDADSKEKAQKIFDDWCEDSENSEELNKVLSERETDTEEWLAPFATSELYDKFCDDDFLIGETHKDPEEPKFDVYFSYVSANPVVTSVVKNITFDDVLDRLRNVNENYYIKPCNPGFPDSCLINHTKGAKALFYDLTRRNKLNG